MAETRTIELEVKQIGLDALKVQLKEAKANAKALAKEFGETSKEAKAAAAAAGLLENKITEVKDASKSLKQQIKEANMELVKAQENFGDYSQEAIKAAKNVAGLKDKIAEASETAALFDPGKKFQAATGAITAAAGAVSAYQGALGLVGVESEQVEAAMLKVQSAMALSQGLSAIADSRKDFERLAVMLGITRKARIVDAAATATQATVTTAASVATGKMTIAQRLLNLVMKANPIFLIIGGITALIGAFALFSGSQEDATEKVSKLNEKLEEQNKFVEYQKKSIDDITAIELANARERGDSEEQLLKIKEDSVNKQVDLAYKNYIETQKAYDEIWELRKKDKATDEQYNDIKKKEQESYDKWQAAQTSRRIASAERDADKAEKDREDAAKKAEVAQQKADAAAQKRLDKRKADLDEINKFTADATKANLDAAKSDQQVELDNIDLKYKAQIELAIKYGKDTTQLIEAQKNEQNLINTKYAQIEIDLEKEKQDKLDALAISENEKRIKLEDALFELERSLTETKLEKELMDLAIAYDEKYALAADNAELIKLLDEQYAKDRAVINKDAADAEIELSKLTTAQKIEAVEAVAATFAQLANLLGEQTAAGKAAAVASATIETFLSAQKAYSATVGIPIVGPVLAPINAGIAIAAGIKNIKAITSVKTPNGGGGGAGNLPTAPSGATAPNFNIVGSSGINQLAELGGQPIQAYVVSGEVTSAQALDRNRIQNASF
jgi:hypothetical protein